MTERAPHPDFKSAEAEHRWGGTLHELSVRLVEQSYARMGKGWVYYILPGGACVAMKITEGDLTKVLRISRRGMKSGDPQAFEAEVIVFAKSMGLEDWLPAQIEVEPEEGGTFKAKGTLTKKYGAKTPSNTMMVKCARCDNEAEQGPFKEPLCSRCAREAGAKEAAERNAVRQESLLP